MADSFCCGSTTPTPSGTSKSALAPILHGFRWLGIDWDEGPEVGGPHAPYYQSQRLPRYQAGGRRSCWPPVWPIATTPRPKRFRPSAKRPRPRSGRFSTAAAGWPKRRPTTSDFAAEGRQAVVRLKMPREGKLVINDQVRGQVEFEWAREQDHVIQRADGTCLYHLASVVDDYDFEITHVIRAEEHLSNTPRQIFIAQSLGYALARVCPSAVRGRAGQQEQAEQAEARQVSEESRFRPDQRAWAGDRRGAWG